MMSGHIAVDVDRCRPDMFCCKTIISICSYNIFG